MTLSDATTTRSHVADPSPVIDLALSRGQSGGHALWAALRSRRRLIVDVSVGAAGVVLLAVLWAFPAPAVGVVAALAGVVTVGMLFRRPRGRVWHQAGTLALVATISVIVWATGGPHSEFRHLFVIPAVVGSLLLPTRWFATTVAATLTAALASCYPDIFTPGAPGGG